NQRIVMAPLEPRGAVAQYDPASGRYTLWCASQSAIVMRQHLARSLGIPPERLRVVTGDVGGAFGMRTSGYPEYPAMLAAAKALGRDGRFLAVDIDVLANLGAYQTSHGAFIATANFARCLPGMYDIPEIGLRIRCVFTHTVPTGPYRGAGRPEANYCLERLIDAAAAATG